MTDTGALTFYVLREGWERVPLMNGWIVSEDDFRDHLDISRTMAVTRAQWKYGTYGCYPILMDGEMPDEVITTTPSEPTC